MVENEAWWAARDSTSARGGHRDQRRWADGRRRRLVTGRIRRDATPVGRESPHRRQRHMAVAEGVAGPVQPGRRGWVDGLQPSAGDGGGPHAKHAVSPGPPD